MEAAAAPRLRTRFALSAQGLASGYVVDPSAPERRFVVDVLADGLPVALLRAQDLHPDLDAAGDGDGCHGFSVALGDELLARTRWLEARLANTGDIVGALEPAARGATAAPARRGAVRWTGGLRLAGWVGGVDPEEPHDVIAIVDGEEIARTACRDWSAIAEGGRWTPVRSFDLHLPLRLADGRARRVEVVRQDGVALDGSPCLVFAAQDGLATHLDRAVAREPDEVRTRFVADLLPQSMPFTAVEAWLARHPVSAPSPATPPRIAVVIVGEAGLDATLASLGGQVGADAAAFVLAGGRSPVGFDPAQLRAALADGAADADAVVFAAAGTRFAPEALALLHDALLRTPGATAAYPDVFVGAGDRRWPLGFPAFDYELFLEQGYCGLVFALRPRAAVDAVAAAGKGPLADTLFGLFLHHCAAGLSDRTAPVHVPALLATLPDLPPDALGAALRGATASHLAARGIPAEVEAAPAGGCRVRVRRHATEADVSVVVPVRNGAEALAATLDGLRDLRGTRIVLVDNDSVDPATLALLDGAARAGHAVVRVGGPFHVGHMLDRGAAAASGRHLLFLRPGLASATPGWIDEMLGRCAERDVGAVGALVASEAGIVEEAGIVVGPKLAVAPRFADRRASDGGYGGWLDVAHQVSALSDACLLTPRALFASLGGFDARRFPSRFHDVDYALRLRAAGHRIVFTPHARLTRPDRMPPAAPDPAAARDLSALRARWSLAPGCDPFYSPWLAMDGAPYSGLAWPPPAAAPRQPVQPAPVPLPTGF